MSAVIEVRTYRAKPGRRAELIKILTEDAFPSQRRLGMKILGPLPSVEDDDGFVWLRLFADEASREPLKTAFYAGPEWTQRLEGQVMPLLAGYEAVAVSDIAGLWAACPAADGEVR